MRHREWTWEMAISRLDRSRADWLMTAASKDWMAFRRVEAARRILLRQVSNMRRAKDPYPGTPPSKAEWSALRIKRWEVEAARPHWRKGR